MLRAAFEPEAHLPLHVPARAGVRARASVATFAKPPVVHMCDIVASKDI